MREGTLVPATDAIAKDNSILPPVAQDPAKIAGHPMVYESDQHIPATIVPNTTNTGLIVTAKGWKLTLAASPASNVPLQLDPEENIVVKPAVGLDVSGSGFAPFSYAKVYVFSTPRLLGTIKTDANGKFGGVLPMPADLQLGKHVLQVSGFSSDAIKRDAFVGLVAVADPKPSTPTTSAASGSVKVGAIPFNNAKSVIGTTQISIIKSIAVTTAKKLTITGYASPTSGEDDIRISLDRALEVKKAILKLHPGLSVSVNVSGAGTSKASACTAFANRCVVVSTL